jgi:Protein of unknown function (DUF2808)
MNFLSVIIASCISFGGLLMAIDSANANSNARNSIHLDQNRQFPETRWANADHYLRVHVPRNSAAMSALLFQVPENLRFDASQVEVFDLKGQKISAAVTEGIDSQVSPPVKAIQIDFSTPIASGNQVDLRIRSVKKFSISRPFTYKISAKLTDSDQERYVGEAYFRSY